MGRAIRVWFLSSRRKWLLDFKVEMEFLAPKDAGQIKLPKFSRESKTRPTLIEIDDPFNPERAPEVRQRNVSANRFQPDIGIERKKLALVDEAIERVTVEMIAMGGICGPIGIRTMRRYNPDAAARFRDAIKLADECDAHSDGVGCPLLEHLEGKL